MCAKNVVRRFSAFLSALVLCFSLTLPCFAAEGDSPIVSATLVWNTFCHDVDAVSVFWSSPQRSKTLSAPFYGSNSTFDTYSAAVSEVPSCASYLITSIEKFYVTSADWLSGAVGLYVSIYSAGTPTPSHWDTIGSPDYWEMFFEDHLGNEGTGSIELSSFTPAISNASPGWTIKATTVADAAAPISKIGFRNAGGSSGGAFSRGYVDTGARGSSLFVPSCTIITTSTSGELAALENMADQISAQSQILSQFYGDVIAVCNSIYQRLGDLQAAQEEANALFSSVITLLNSTNGKLDAINQAMSTYFELVLKSLANESLSIQQAIADAELRLETYLKPIVDYFNELEETTGESAATLPQHKTDLDGFASDSTGIDGDAQTGLAAILPILTAFGFIFQILGIFIGLGILGIIVRKGLS